MPQSIDAALVRKLVATQFPRWAGLQVSPVPHGGWDNRSFRLGEYLVVRLPSAADYAAQVDKEQHWLPKLAPWLPLPIPAPVATGKPAEDYPWPWSIYEWIDGDTAATARIADPREFAGALAGFLLALQRIDTAGGPEPGAHNFHRGGSLMHYDAQTRQAIAALQGSIDAEGATEVWETALATAWRGAPVWVHGDVSAGNLLVRDGRLVAVIDFGNLAVGDPACDLAIAWTLFGNESRDAFRALLPLDNDTWARGRAWTLWKALIVAAGLARSNAPEVVQPARIVAEVVADHRRGA